LGPYLNLVLHGHIHKDGLAWVDSNVPIISTGSAALKAEARPEEVGNQYQCVRISAEKLERFTRRYDPLNTRWGGDTRCSPGGDSWHFSKRVPFSSVHGTFSKTPPLESATPGASETEEQQIVQIDKPLDSLSASQKLKSLPRFRLRPEGQHRVVRLEE